MLIRLMSCRLLLLVHAATAAQRAGVVMTAEDGLETRVPPVLARPSGRIDWIWCSPYRAARETAGRMGVTATNEPQLADLDFGRWSGRSLLDLATDHPEAFAAWLEQGSASAHGGEAIKELMTRISGWMQGVSATGGRHLGITHAMVARAAIVSALGCDASSFRRIDFDPLTLVRLDERQGRWSLRAIAPLASGCGDQT